MLFDRLLSEAGGPEMAYLKELFPAQRRVYDDSSLFRTQRCTRRAGKTTFTGIDLIATSDKHPGDEWSVYVALSKGVARRNIGGIMDGLIRRYDLPITMKGTDGQLIYEHANGHKIWLAGCKDRSECEKFRGPKLRQVKIDEPASMKSDVLEYLVEDVFEPALSDLDGTLDLVGTPGVLPVGFFWEVDTGLADRPQWSAHSWSVVDNPHHQADEAWLEKLRARRGWTEENPTYQREWLGRWVADNDAIIYPYTSARNGLWTPELPVGDYFYVLSVDLGWSDDATFTVSCSRRGFGEVYFLESYGRPGMLTSEVAAEMKRIQHRYRINTTVVDTGGLGKTIAMDLSRTYGIPCKAAEKRDKPGAIRMMKDAILAGLVQVRPGPCSQLLAEWSCLPWNDDRTDHHGSYADHCSDGAVYGFREHPTFETWKPEGPKPGTSGWIEAQMKAERAKALAPKKRKRGRL